MEIVAKKIEAVKRILIEEFMLGEEAGHGYNAETKKKDYFTRVFMSRQFVNRCSILEHELDGIGRILKKDGFIVDYYRQPSLEDFGNGEIIIIKYPLSFAEDHKLSDKPFAWITYDPKIRAIAVNDEFQLSRPDFESDNERFFTYVYANHGKRILKVELDKQCIKRSPNAILGDLGFEGALRQAFFPSVSAKGVYFRKQIFKNELDTSGVNEDNFLAQLAELKNRKK